MSRRLARSRRDRVIELSGGTASLVDGFVTDAGVIIVSRDRLVLAGRNGASLA
jgi:hypothetical protein